ncbi:MAG: phosphodiester glycosidase family protein [Clostridia bacterium]|nr:phosphodiester glycosidase family protein [Clostridia bacterium]
MEPIVKSVEYVDEGERFVAYVASAERCNVTATLRGEPVRVLSNLREPFDFRMHIFLLPAAALRGAGSFRVLFERRRKDRPSLCFEGDSVFLEEDIAFSQALVRKPDDSVKRSDRGLTFDGVTDSGDADGLAWKAELFRTPDGAPVRVFTMWADPGKCGILCGTPHMKPEFAPGVIQRVIEEAEEAQALGYDVIGAANGDFFDMFGDCRPSGLCVRGGTVVANADSDNPFLGITRGGEAVIGRASDYPPETLDEAIAGGQIILLDGEIHDTAAFRPFGEVTHPRTAYGIGYDGRVIVTVVDGRRKAWSNGASLCELALIMKRNGARIAMNTDGGGSSTFIVKKEGELTMLNHPADLVRPDDDLIRPLFDSILIYRKN